jgi:hypothetical protein
MGNPKSQSLTIRPRHPEHRPHFSPGPPVDLKNLETYLLDTGDFALETHGNETSSRIEGFLFQKE